MKEKQIIRTITGQQTQDGAGVTLVRSLGKTQQHRFDPFLLMDYFASENANDYIAGFPPHPHRGFETVTYLLNGTMLHRDHMGNEGVLQAGSVQWMTAGRGVIHEECPQQEEGLLRGFQLWVNLPASEKMKPAHYQNIEAADIPEIELSSGVVRLIAGEMSIDGKAYEGAVRDIAIQPIYADIRLKANASLELPITENLNSLVFLYEGEGRVSQTDLQDGVNLLGEGDTLVLESGDKGMNVLLLAGRPLSEPIVQYGPFVMNTQEEIEQAIHDYKRGVLVE